jgi:SAM-dependent methyltransferase
MDACRICRGRFGRRFSATERMFGLGGSFNYGECDRCGAVQLLNPPADLSRYYPPNYYSFGETVTISSLLPRNPLRRQLCIARNGAQLFGGWLRPVAALRPRPELAPVANSIRDYGIRSFGARVLDVGCGSGQWLRQLRNVGMTHLEGCDPFAPAVREPNLTIHSCSIDQLPGTAKYDSIVFAHSLEHVADQSGTLQAAARLLAPRGRIVIRVPVAASQPYREYGGHWVELDAPRHFVLHPRESARILAEHAGLKVVGERSDGIPIEFWGSELYRRGLTLVDESGRMRDPKSAFSPAEIRAFDERTAAARNQGTSGRLIFFLEHAAT